MPHHPRNDGSLNPAGMDRFLWPEFSRKNRYRLLTGLEEVRSFRKENITRQIIIYENKNIRLL